MRILIFNTLYFPYRVGGAEQSLQILAERLVLLGHKVRVISLTDKSKPFFNEINGVEVAYYPIKNIYWPFSDKKRSKLIRLFWHLFDYYNPFIKSIIKGEVEGFSPSVVHTNNLSGFSIRVWKLAFKEKLKIIHTLRDYYLIYPNSSLYLNGRNISTKGIKVTFWSWLKKRLSINVNCVVGISQHILDKHIELGYFVNSRKTVVFNPVEVSSPKKAVNYSGISIGFIGRLSSEKGFDEFCRYAQKIGSEGVRYLAAGKYRADLESEYLKRLAKEASIVELGFVELDDFLSSVDVVVLPLKWEEPFGRVIVECALAGKYVFVNPVGGAKELINILPNVFDFNVAPRSAGELISFLNGRHIASSDNYSQLFSPFLLAKRYSELYCEVVK